MRSTSWQTMESTGTQRSVLSLPKRHVDGPLLGAERAQTIEGEIDAFADAHAGVTQKQQGIRKQVVAAPQFLLDQLILLWS